VLRLRTLEGSAERIFAGSGELADVGANEAILVPSPINEALDPALRRCARRPR
jgi:hypothetical protein